MTIQDLYNALEKAIDSGEATLDTGVWVKSEGYGTDPVNTAKIDVDGDFVLSYEY